MEWVTIRYLGYETNFEMEALAKNVLLKDAEEIRNSEKRECKNFSHASDCYLGAETALVLAFPKAR
jgi:hypothetical protein